MPSMKWTLKIKLAILALVFPISFGIIGVLIGIFLQNKSIVISFSISGLLLGTLFNMVCIYRKLFTIVLYQAPLPLALFLLTWWVSNSFTNDLMAVIIGLIGFLIGLWLNVELVLPYQFYKIKKRVLALIYLFFSIASLGFFMGIPVFNLLLGVLAGNYLSIRVLRNYKSKKYIRKNLIQGSIYTSIILLIITFFSGLIVISDMENSISILEQLLHYPINQTLFLSFIIIGGLVIVILQYFITLFTATTMLQLWQYRRMT